MLEVIGKLNLIDRVIVPFTREDLSSYKKYFDAPVCEICHTNHLRNELYIIRTEDNTIVAGKGCMNKMFGKQVVSNAIKVAKDNAKVYNQYRWKVDHLFAAAIAYLEDNKFISRNDALTYGGPSSSDDFKLDGVYQYYCNESFKKYGAQADKIVEYYRQHSSDNSFIENAAQLIANEYCSDKVLGLFPAFVNSYYKTLEREAIAKKVTESTEYFGNIGDKIKNENIEVEIVYVSFEKDQGYTYWDTNHLYVRTWMKDNNGHLFVWNNGFIDKTKNEYVEEIGTKVKLINFTVKNHFESKKYGRVTSIVRPKYEIC